MMLRLKKHLIVHHGLHQIAHVRILLSQGLIQFLSHRITIPITRWNAAVLQETGVVHRSMVGTQENQIISFAHLLIEIRKENRLSPCPDADKYPRSLPHEFPPDDRYNPCLSSLLPASRFSLSAPNCSPSIAAFAKINRQRIAERSLRIML